MNKPAGNMTQSLRQLDVSLGQVNILRPHPSAERVREKYSPPAGLYPEAPHAEVWLGTQT